MIYILYGSQTGQAKSIADGIYEKFESISDKIKLHELDEIDKSYCLNNIGIAIIVCSTTGDGDAPENAARFTRILKAHTNSLSHIQYTVLGLGDTNYSNFCNGGKTIENRMVTLGASKFYPSAWADDAVGLEAVVDPWVDGLFEAVKSVNLEDLNNVLKNLKISELNTIETFVELNNDHFGKNPVTLLGDHLVGDVKHKDLNIPILQPAYLEITYHNESLDKVDKLKPVICEGILPAEKTKLELGKLIKIEKVTNKFAVKNVYRIDINVENNDWVWCAGDSVAILPRNSTDEVEAILDRLNIRPEERDCHLTLSVMKNTEKRRAKIPDHLITVGSASISVRSALIWLCDIRQPVNKAGLRIMADFCPNGSAEKRRLLELCSKEGQILYTRCLREPSLALLDLLNWFPNCQIPINRLFEVLPRLKPRAYSLCSLKTISFAFSHVDIAPKQSFRSRPLTGVATTWMQNLSVNEESVIPIYLRKNMNEFKIADDYAGEPYIMIGPGTGVAPFITFLEHFRNLKESGSKLGPIWLFYGCRHKERDYLFKEELQSYLHGNILTHLCVCFSRESSTTMTPTSDSSSCESSGKYVQDCIRCHGKDLVNMLLGNGEVSKFRIFVCGDVTNMSRDVLNTWTDILMEHGSSYVSSRKDAEGLVAKWRLQRLYIEDVWA